MKPKVFSRKALEARNYGVNCTPIAPMICEEAPGWLSNSVWLARCDRTDGVEGRFAFGPWVAAVKEAKRFALRFIKIHVSQAAKEDPELPKKLAVYEDKRGKKNLLDARYLPLLKGLTVVLMKHDQFRAPADRSIFAIGGIDSTGAVAILISQVRRGKEPV